MSKTSTEFTRIGFEQEMASFFRGYSDAQRARVEASLSYREAAKVLNAERAQRIAVEILEGNATNLKEARMLREYR